MTQIPTVLYGKDLDKWSATPSTTLLHKITQRDYTGGSARWIAVIERKGFQTIRVALGDPKRSTECSLELPQWLLLEEGGYGEEVIIKYEKSEKYKKAKHLVFRALADPMEEEYSLEEFLEQPLSELGILEEGQMIRVPVLEIPLLLEKVEPSGEPVFLDGLEVGLEILWPEQVGRRPPATIGEQSAAKLLPAAIGEKEGKYIEPVKEVPKQVDDHSFDCMLPMNYPGVSEFYSTGPDKFKGCYGGMKLK